MIARQISRVNLAQNFAYVEALAPVLTEAASMAINNSMRETDGDRETVYGYNRCVPRVQRLIK